MYVYPVMQDRFADGETVVAHDKEEHQELEQVMKELEGVDAADPEFLTVLARLEQVPRDHVSDEENGQFPRLRAELPHETFHKMVGPGVGMVDRLRDKLTGRSTSA